MNDFETTLNWAKTQLQNDRLEQSLVERYTVDSPNGVDPANRDELPEDAILTLFDHHEEINIEIQQALFRSWKQAYQNTLECFEDSAIAQKYKNLFTRVFRVAQICNQPKIGKYAVSALNLLTKELSKRQIQQVVAAGLPYTHKLHVPTLLIVMDEQSGCTAMIFQTLCKIDPENIATHYSRVLYKRYVQQDPVACGLMAAHILSLADSKDPIIYGIKLFLDKEPNLIHSIVEEIQNQPDLWPDEIKSEISYTISRNNDNNYKFTKSAVTMVQLHEQSTREFTSKIYTNIEYTSQTDSGAHYKPSEKKIVGLITNDRNQQRNTPSANQRRSRIRHFFEKSGQHKESQRCV